AALVRATSSDTGTRRATFLPTICFTPTAPEPTGFWPPSDTQPAAGMSMDTGTAVLAVRASGTRRGGCCTADSSSAFSKMGPATVTGRSVELTLERALTGMGCPFCEWALAQLAVQELREVGIR